MKTETFYVTWHNSIVHKTTDWNEAIKKASIYIKMNLTGIRVTKNEPI